MKIYTRTGDDGQTSLFGGGRIAKHHPRVSAYGEVDELNAAIGVAVATEPTAFESELLTGIQRDLFAIGGQLASPNPAKVAKALQKAEISEDRILEMERAIDRAESELPTLRHFILPGGCPKGSFLHYARTVCRRAERAVVSLSETETVPDIILQYLNRLSDLLFTLARLANRRQDVTEHTW